MDAIVAAQEAGAGSESGAELEELAGQFERLSARLDEVVGGRDGELSGRFERLSARFDELVALHEQAGSRLEAIAAAQKAGPGRESAAELEELAGQLERLSARLDEVVGGRDEVSRLSSSGCRRGLMWLRCMSSWGAVGSDRRWPGGCCRPRFGG